MLDGWLKTNFREKGVHNRNTIEERQQFAKDKDLRSPQIKNVSGLGTAKWVWKWKSRDCGYATWELLPEVILARWFWKWSSGSYLSPSKR
jgi:hypothetical protein